MEKKKIKEITISNIYELLAEIKNGLTICEDTQIFISNQLLKRLLQENKNSIIWEEEVLNSFHYCDKEEKAFIIKIKINNEENTFQIHFVENCLEYVQLSYFASKGILYRHYLKGIKTILIINTD